MIRKTRTGTAGFCVIALTVLSACDSASVGATLDTTADDLSTTLVPSDTDAQPEGDEATVGTDTVTTTDLGTSAQSDDAISLDDANGSEESNDLNDSSDAGTSTDQDESVDSDEFTDTTSESTDTSSESTDTTSESTDTSSESTDTTSESIDTSSESTDTTSESTDTSSESTDTTSESTDTSSESTDTTSESTDTGTESTVTTSESTDTSSESTDTTSESTDTGSESTVTTSESTDTSSESTDTTSESTDTSSESTDTTSESTDTSSESTDTSFESSDTTSESTDTSSSDDASASEGSDEQLSDASATGSDLSDSEDDSVVPAETASLAGPFIEDRSRSAGPPSVPQDLTLLLAGETWLEFTWAPSTDDQSVEAYEIYRDGQLLATVRGDTGYEHDYRSWLSTSYIDCNYTRYTTCEDVQPVPGSTYSYSVVAVDNEGMKSANSEAALFTLAQSGTAPIDLTGYVTVFNEEFNGTALDPTRWKTVLPWGEDTTINNETQHFVNIFSSDPMDHNPFVFTGETVQITGIDTPAELAEEANNKPYLSGVLTTSDNFEMTYGYVEMQAKLAGGEGLLSTFFLFNQDYEKNKPEIDIIEYIGSRPDKAYQTYHYYDSNRARYFSGEKHSSPTMETVYSTPLSDGFHNYSVLWEPELVIWYIDGIEVRRITGPRVSDEPMNIITQLVIGSEWIGTPAASSIPAVLEIDYIRAWQQQ